MKDCSGEFKDANSNNTDVGLVLFEKTSKYGEVTVTQEKELFIHREKMCGMRMNDEKELAELSIKAMEGGSVLVIGLGCGITAREVLKHRDDVDIVEINPVVVEAQKLFFNLNANIVIADANNYLKDCRKYDLIIVDVSNPYSRESKQCFTKEFHEALKNKGKLVVFWNYKGLDFVAEHYKLFQATFNSSKIELEYSTIYFGN